MKNKYIVGSIILYVVCAVSFLLYIDSRNNVEAKQAKQVIEVKTYTKTKSKDIFDSLPIKKRIQIYTNDQFMEIVDELSDKVVEGKLKSEDIYFMDLDGDGDLDIKVRDGKNYILYINVINENK